MGIQGLLEKIDHILAFILQQKIFRLQGCQTRSFQSMLTPEVGFVWPMNWEFPEFWQWV